MKNQDPGTHISLYRSLEETWWQDLKSRNCNQKIPPPSGRRLYGPSKEISSSSSWQITGIRNSFRGLTTLPVFHRSSPARNKPSNLAVRQPNEWPNERSFSILRIETYPTQILSVNGAVFHPLHPDRTTPIHSKMSLTRAIAVVR